MAESSKSLLSTRNIIVGGVILAAVTVVGLVLARGEEPEQEGAQPAVQATRGATGPRRIPGRPRPPRDRAEGSRHRQPINRQLPAGPGFSKLPWNPIRPYPLVVRYGEKGDGRTQAEARQLIEEARSRFLKGEDAGALIRELSDPPVGVPRELSKQWTKLPPDKASPVFPVESGFVVFFGTPLTPSPGRPGRPARPGPQPAPQGGR